MSGWRDIVAQLRGEAAPDDAVPPPDPPARPAAPPVVSSMPPWLAQEVSKLRGARPPRLQRPETWRPVLDGAETVLGDGWAAQALALGWHPLELFGIDADGGDQYNGLAVWLQRRRLVLLDDNRAISEDPSWRAFFHRQRHFRDGGDGTGLAVFLWDFGRRP